MILETVGVVGGVHIEGWVGALVMVVVKAAVGIEWIMFSC